MRRSFEHAFGDRRQPSFVEPKTAADVDQPRKRRRIANPTDVEPPTKRHVTQQAPKSFVPFLEKPQKPQPIVPSSTDNNGTATRSEESDSDCDQYQIQTEQDKAIRAAMVQLATGRQKKVNEDPVDKRLEQLIRKSRMQSKFSHAERSLSTESMELEEPQGGNTRASSRGDSREYGSQMDLD